MFLLLALFALCNSVALFRRTDDHAVSDTYPYSIFVSSDGSCVAYTGYYWAAFACSSYTQPYGPAYNCYQNTRYCCCGSCNTDAHEWHGNCTCSGLYSSNTCSLYNENGSPVGRRSDDGSVDTPEAKKIRRDYAQALKNAEAEGLPYLNAVKRAEEQGSHTYQNYGTHPNALAYQCGSPVFSGGFLISASSCTAVPESFKHHAQYLCKRGDVRGEDCCRTC